MSDDHFAHGERLRETHPAGWLGEWRPPRDRDPLRVLKHAARGRDPELVSQRNQDMGNDPWEFFRGAAGIMACDLKPARSKTSGVDVDICGDAHLGNFGMYGSPERTRVFDLNDFDEARPGPWEWDLCRLAASAAVAGRHKRDRPVPVDALVSAIVDSYGNTVAGLAAGRFIDRWYAFARQDSIIAADLGLAGGTSQVQDAVRMATQILGDAEDETQAATVAELVGSDGEFRDAHKQRPLHGNRADEVRHALVSYLKTVSPGLERLLSGYRPSAVAKRPVGEGSLGLPNYLLLIRAQNPGDELILQVKEAIPSQLELALKPLPKRHQGERVVEMARSMQGVSDPLLGWTTIDDRPYYVRQYRDRKGAPDLDALNAEQLVAYVRLCSTTLARAHARGPATDEKQLTIISGYLGQTNTDRAEFRQGLTQFAARYADLTLQDQSALAASGASARAPAGSHR
jgi:uncharacterized protein (DUF2252 family)